MTGEGLNHRQELAVEILASGEPLPMAEVARRAGYEDSQPARAGHRLATNANVQAAVQERRLSLAEQAGIKPVDVLKRVSRRARSPLTPPATAQRADEYLGDVLGLREALQQAPTFNTLNLTVTSDEAKDLARLIAGDET